MRRGVAALAAGLSILVLAGGCGETAVRGADATVAGSRAVDDASPEPEAATDAGNGAPSGTGRLGPALEGVYVEAAAQVVPLANDAVRVESPSSCESTRLQLLGGDASLVADFAPVSMDFGPLGSAVDPGGFTMVIDSRLVYVTLVEPAEVLGCTAMIVPGASLDEPLPTSIAPSGARAWSVTTSCRSSLDETVAVSAYLVASDGGGAQVGFTVSGTGARRTVSDVVAMTGRGPGGFVAAHREVLASAMASPSLTEDADILSLLPEGVEMGEYPVTGTVDVAVDRDPPGLAGTVRAGSLRFRFRCAE